MGSELCPLSSLKQREKLEDVGFGKVIEWEWFATPLLVNLIHQFLEGTKILFVDALWERSEDGIGHQSFEIIVG